eukprot:jgi/Botrbrau1/13842/Bobra.0056s0079.1
MRVHAGKRPCRGSRNPLPGGFQRLVALPDELWVKIIGLLDLKDQCCLSACCREFDRICLQYEDAICSAHLPDCQVKQQSNDMERPKIVCIDGRLQKYTTRVANLELRLAHHIGKLANAANEVNNLSWSSYTWAAVLQLHQRTFPTGEAPALFWTPEEFSAFCGAGMASAVLTWCKDQWPQGIQEHATAVRRVVVTSSRHTKAAKETTALLASLDAMRCGGWEERLRRYREPLPSRVI